MRNNVHVFHIHNNDLGTVEEGPMISPKYKTMIDFDIGDDNVECILKKAFYGKVFTDLGLS